MDKNQGYVNKKYLEQAAQTFKSIKGYSYKMMSISAGDCVLDVGCGPGIDVLQLAKQVGPKGLAVGIDHDSQMIEEAKSLAQSEKVDEIVKLHVHDITSLPFENEYFDSCRSERVFMHLQNPLATLREMHRVTKVNGRVVVAESDWSSLSIDCDAVGTEKKIFQYHRDKIMASGYTGRSLFRFFRVTGFSEIDVNIFPVFTTDLRTFSDLVRLEYIEEQALSANAISKQELAKWREQLQHANEQGYFFCSMNVFIVAGTKYE
jgi:ubiquinone/menaquinone biosynthesis C-methylase UbiE